MQDLTPRGESLPSLAPGVEVVKDPGDRPGLRRVEVRDKVAVASILSLRKEPHRAA